MKLTSERGLTASFLSSVTYTKRSISKGYWMFLEGKRRKKNTWMKSYGRGEQLKVLPWEVILFLQHHFSAGPSWEWEEEAQHSQQSKPSSTAWPHSTAGEHKSRAGAELQAACSCPLTCLQAAPCRSQSCWGQEWSVKTMYSIAIIEAGHPLGCLPCPTLVAVLTPPVLANAGTSFPPCSHFPTRLAASLCCLRITPLLLEPTTLPIAWQWYMFLWCSY